MYSAPELLKSHHHLSLFDCGEEVLNLWLKRNALKNQQNQAVVIAFVLRLFYHYSKGGLMANLNIRIDDTIKQRAFLAFDNLGINPSEAIRTFLTYVADTGRMPIKQIIVSDEDAELYEVVKKRLNEPEKITATTLDELFS